MTRPMTQPLNPAHVSASQAVFALFESGSKGQQDFDRLFCEAVAEALGAELASVLEPDASGGTLHFRYAMGMEPAEASRFEFRLGEGICGAAALTGRTIAVADAQHSAQHAGIVDEQTDIRTRSIISAPALRDGRCVAVVNVLNKRVGEFDERDKELARAFILLYAADRTARAGSAGSKKAGSRRRSAMAPVAIAPDGLSIIGASPLVERTLGMAIKAASTEWPILVLGETGTGKELLVRRIHRESRRAGKPLLAINCAALSETLLESELFGHVRGAFTGADRNRRGKLEQSDGATVFLDEVGDMSPACQAKLLRTIDYGEITPVGSNEVRKIDVRIISATNRPLEEMVESGEFRRDLFYRLRGIELRLPPLRERGGDLELLAGVFLDEAVAERGSAVTGFSESAWQLIASHSWPGNIRELRRAIQSAVTSAEGETIEASDLPLSVQEASGAVPRNGMADIRGTGSVGIVPLAGASIAHGESPGRPSSKFEPAPPDSIYAEERREIIEALGVTAYPGTGRWNLAAAARRLGMSRKKLEYRVKSVHALASAK